MGVMDRIYQGLLGTPSNYGGLLDTNTQTQAMNDGRSTIPLALLANSGWTDRPVSLTAAIGQAALAGRQAQNDSLQQALQMQLLQKREQDGRFGAISPDKFTPESLAKFQKSRNYADLVERNDPNKDPSEVAAYKYWSSLTPQQQQDFLKLKRNVGADYAIETVNGVPTVVYKPAAGGPGVSGGTPLVTPLTNLDKQAAGAGTISGAQAGGAATAKGSAERAQGFIDAGQSAADAISTVRRGLDLLDSVGTGGIDNAKLAITQAFGVTGADESELSANLGKAVLHQLRATFGSQFTEKEGERLSSIEAGFGKSTEGNKRLLQQTEKILDRVARRGIDAAEQTQDKFSADEIRKSLQFTLSPNASTPSTAAAPVAPVVPSAPKAAPDVGTVKGGYRFKGGDPANKDNWEPVK